MANEVRFGCTALAGTGKKGILAPDANGYRTMIIGALEVTNSAGEYYVAKGAKDLFLSSSEFQRRVKDGCLKAEVGHPKRLPGMKYDDYVQRAFSIYEDNVCAHIAEVWLDFDFGKTHPEYNNPRLIAIMARVKPAGPKANALEDAFNNPEENVCFSIRAVTTDQLIRGVNHRTLERIIAFDWVTEPGIMIAKKFVSPALESLSSVVLTKDLIVSAMKKIPKGLGFESVNNGMQSVLPLFDEVKVNRGLAAKW